MDNSEKFRVRIAIPVFVAVSQATFDNGSSARHASRTASDT